MRRTMQLYLSTGRMMTNVDLPNHANPTLEFQLRYDLAQSYNLMEGEGYFTVMEDGEVVNKHDIPWI